MYVCVCVFVVKHIYLFMYMFIVKYLKLTYILPSKQAHIYPTKNLCTIWSIEVIQKVLLCS